jgi:hypothetical protein
MQTAIIGSVGRRPCTRAGLKELSVTTLGLTSQTIVNRRALEVVLIVAGLACIGEFANAPEQASRLPVDVPRFPEGSVSWPESVFATFRVADA